MTAGLTVLTTCAYLTNSSQQVAATSLSARITPILVLSSNVPHARLAEPRGNYMLNQTMGVETHVIDVNWVTSGPTKRRERGGCGHHRAPDGRNGGANHQPMVTETRDAHPDGVIVHAKTIERMLVQSPNAGVELHFPGTRTAMPPIAGRQTDPRAFG